MKLSEKKKNELYASVSEEVTQARLKIWKMRFEEKPSIAVIDDILSDLNFSAPQKAIECFDKC